MSMREKDRKHRSISDRKVRSISGNVFQGASRGDVARIPMTMFDELEEDEPTSEPHKPSSPRVAEETR